MSEPISLPDLIKSLPISSDASGKSILMNDPTGNLHRIANRGILGLGFTVADRGGANILPKGTAIILAVDDNASDKYCLYVARKVSADSFVACHVISNNGITIKATNTFGTINVTGADSITQYALIMP